MIDDHMPSDLDRLSMREWEVVALVAQGLRNREIAEKISLRETTVKSHLRVIFEKLHVHKRLELATYATFNGLS
jgi:DNA-binding NarL/FixJ family response regulator